LQIKLRDTFISSLTQDNKVKSDSIQEMEKTIQQFDTKMGNMKFNVTMLTQDLETANQEILYFKRQLQEKDKILLEFKNKMELITNEGLDSAARIHEKEEIISELQNKLDNNGDRFLEITKNLNEKEEEL